MVQIPYHKLDSEIQVFFDKNLKEKCEVLRTTVIDNSNLETSKFWCNDLDLKIRTFNEKTVLGILSWYMPDEIRFLVNLWLSEHWGGEHKEVKTAVLTSKCTALGYLIVQERWSTRDFFGNILQKKLLQPFIRGNLKRRLDSKPKSKVFRRGYNDKGSLRPTHLSVIFDQKKLRTFSQQQMIEIQEQEKISILLERIDEQLRKERVI